MINHIERRMGLKRPTNVQVEAVKALVPKDDVFRDAMIRSETGSGKTFAFLFPIAHALLERKKKVDRTEGTLAVIIEPTRELAAQVRARCNEVFHGYLFHSVCASLWVRFFRARRLRTFLRFVVRCDCCHFHCSGGNCSEGVVSTMALDCRECSDGWREEEV